MAAGPAGRGCDAAGDEAGEKDPRPCHRLFRGAVLLQLPARRRAGKRRGPPEGGAAAAAQPHHALRRRHGGACRRCAGGGPRGLRPQSHRGRAEPSQYHHDPRRGRVHPGGGRGHRLRPPDLRPAGGCHRRQIGRRQYPELFRRRRAAGVLRQRGHEQRLFRQPLRQGHAGLHQLPHDKGGVSGLLAGSDHRSGGGGPWLRG